MEIRELREIACPSHADKHVTHIALKAEDK